MARHIDESKLVSIKKKTMQIIVEQGISGASISEIARGSGVSVGYLYRFYKGKRELLEALFEERSQRNYDMLSKHMAENEKVTDLIVAYVHQLFANAEEEGITICFYHKLLNDFSFEIPEKNRLEIQELCNRIVQLGKKNGEIREGITNEQFFTIVVGGTLQFITLRFRNIFSQQGFLKGDIEQTIQTVIRALK